MVALDAHKRWNLHVLLNLASLNTDEQAQKNFGLWYIFSHGTAGQKLKYDKI